LDRALPRLSSPVVPPQTVKVAPVLLRTVLLEARRVGVDSPKLCNGLGFTAQDLDIPGFMVSHDEAAIMLRRALAAIDNPLLGLELGLRSNLANLGALALGLMASPTAGHAVSLIVRFPASAGLLLSLDEELAAQDHALLAMPLPGSKDLEPFLVDKLFAELVRLCRQGTDADYAPRVVELRRQQPADTQAYEDCFGCPVRFASPRNRLVSAASWMRFSLPTANRMALRYAEEALQGEAVQAMESAVGLAVGRVLRQPSPHPTSPAKVASSLNLSERTLRRRLMESGLSYRKMKDEGRKERALTLVKNGQMDLADVARETGFADLSNFRRAFKRWTGRTPNQMRDHTDD
jgi:AraC-like DNA-binding protein